MHDMTNFPAALQSLNLVGILPRPNSIRGFTKACVTFRNALVVTMSSQTPNQTPNSVLLQLQAVTPHCSDIDPLNIKPTALHALHVKIQANKKVNFIIEEAIKAWGGESTDTPSLTSALNGHRHAPVALPQGNRPAIRGTVQ